MPEKESARSLINPHDATYHQLLRDIIKNGTEVKKDRTGVGTKYVFGRLPRFDLTKGFPLITSKYTWFKGVTTELLWFIAGDTNIRPLLKKGNHIWDEWVYERYLKENHLSQQMPTYSPEWQAGLKLFIRRLINDKKFSQQWGDAGPAYPKQWRNQNRYDPLADAIHIIRNNATSRRILVDTWNAPEIFRAVLPPCHYSFQFDSSTPGELSILVIIRSWDTVLGAPFNIASYALLCHMVAQITQRKAKDLIISSGNTHIYLNHLDILPQQLMSPSFPAPTLWLNPEIQEIDDFTDSDIQIRNYKHGPRIKYPIAV